MVINGFIKFINYIKFKAFRKAISLKEYIFRS